MKGFSVIVACDASRGIGVDNAMPWRLPGEMAYFKRVTCEAKPGLQNAVVMGRKTYESIPPKFRPLAGRKNVVLSHNARLELPDSVMRSGSLDEALESLRVDPKVDQVFVIGGGSVYAQALADPRCERVFLTQVHHNFACDTFLPALPEVFRLDGRDGPHQDLDISYTFETYVRHAP